ncbi:uncharacterized protein LOC110459200 [Mizuhopecten yessoensis]|uniref:TIR domain-containing protein n=1 Tax=Mizuhopecten yessoensis TaxID=6573 RepID=A0A210Q524_MIZYE|nr:uncharacterized protein LOC110459200 [Mizuhopecten yessoensis]OWF43843.1 hypothetical protein KP79_PYT10170 [Mizuhopecten yessoensis]
MDLTLSDTISMWTPTGTYEIQLLYGDITKLRQEDSVNLIMVSAFPGDYAPMRGTVIGALKTELGMNVHQLSRSMELDLRRQFHCWLSQPLEGHLPYKRLLCFERTRGDCTIVEDIRQMFRVFVPVFNNKETTVITPLLATGHQNKSPEHVLSVMLHCAAQWIMAGLPLKCFKIVIYGSQNKSMSEIFSKIKDTYTKLSKKRMEKSLNLQTFDIFIMFQDADKHWCKKIEKTLRKKKSDIKICADVQIFKEDEVWQDQIFQKMSSCLKIIVVLTPLFVNSSECLEQFNMAMCCNRLRKGNILQPFYVLTVESMPVYITLVQYQDCRVRKEADSIETKIQDACSMLVERLSGQEEEMDEVKNNILDLPGPARTKQYDIFISYSHKNPDQAGDLLKELLGAKPEPKIFYDRSELTMGSMWQKTLYDSVDGARCVIALVSQTYVSSLICQEEYNIALLRHLIDPTKILFLPVCIEDLSSTPHAGFCKVDMVDGRGDNFAGAVDFILKMVINWLQTGEKGHFNVLEKELKGVNYKDIFETIRTRYVATNYKLHVKDFTIYRKSALPEVKASPEDQDKQECDVAIGFAGDATYCAMVLNHVLDNLHPELKVRFLWERNKSLLQDIDTARAIVLFLSEEFVSSEEHMQNLHLALCRQRLLKGRRVVHFVQTMDLPGEHSFLKLLPMAANFKDRIWYDYVKNRGGDKADKMRKYVISKVVDMSGTFSCSYNDYLAMVKVADDVMDEILRTDKEEASEQAEPMLLNLLKVKQELQEDTDSTDIHLIKVNELVLETKEGQSSQEIQNQKGSETTGNNPATTTGIVSKPTEDKSATTGTVSKPTENKSATTGTDSKPTEDKTATTGTVSKPTEDKSATTGTVSKPTEENSTTTETASKPTEDKTATTGTVSKPTEDKSVTTTETVPKPTDVVTSKVTEEQSVHSKPGPVEPDHSKPNGGPTTETQRSSESKNNTVLTPEKSETHTVQDKPKIEKTANNTKTSKSCQIL